MNITDIIKLFESADDDYVTVMSLLPARIKSTFNSDINSLIKTNHMTLWSLYEFINRLLDPKHMPNLKKLSSVFTILEPYIIATLDTNFKKYSDNMYLHKLCRTLLKHGYMESSVVNLMNNNKDAVLQYIAKSISGYQDNKPNEQIDELLSYGIDWPELSQLKSKIYTPRIERILNQGPDRWGYPGEYEAVTYMLSKNLTLYDVPELRPQFDALKQQFLNRNIINLDAPQYAKNDIQTWYRTLIRAGFEWPELHQPISHDAKQLLDAKQVHIMQSMVNEINSNRFDVYAARRLLARVKNMRTLGVNWSELDFLADTLTDYIADNR